MSALVPSRADLERAAAVARREHARAELAERQVMQLRAVIEDLVGPDLPRTREWQISQTMLDAQRHLDALPAEDPEAVMQRRMDLLDELSRPRKEAA